MTMSLHMPQSNAGYKYSSMAGRVCVGSQPEAFFSTGIKLKSNNISKSAMEGWQLLHEVSIVNIGKLLLHYPKNLSN